MRLLTTLRGRLPLTAAGAQAQNPFPCSPVTTAMPFSASGCTDLRPVMVGHAPAQAARRVRDEMDRRAALVRAAGIKPE